MKKVLSLLLVFILIFSLVACSNNNDAEKTHEIKFSQSVEEIKKYDGKTVKINGYMATVSPDGGSLFYLMNLPFQSFPFLEAKETELTNTIAVKGSGFEFTTLPVEITGTLVFGNFSDAYGLEYSYRIEDAKVRELSKEEVSENNKIYYDIAKDNSLVTVFTIIDCIGQVAYYEDMGIDPKEFKGYGDIPFSEYSFIKSSVELLNTNGKYDDFLTILNKTEETRIKVNKDMQEDNIEAYASYQTVTDELMEMFNKFISQFKI